MVPPHYLGEGGEIFLDPNYLGVFSLNFFHLGGKTHVMVGAQTNILGASLLGPSGTYSYTTF